MQFTVEPVRFEDKGVLWRLMQLYLHDMSEFTGEDVGSDGEYSYTYFDHYWAPDPGEERYPLFIRVDGVLAGFALVRKADGQWRIAEFFIMRRFRRSGLGSEAATTIFRMFPGTWLVHELGTNLPAQAFWPKVIGDMTGGRLEQGIEADGAHWQRFEITPR